MKIKQHEYVKSINSRTKYFFILKGKITKTKRSKKRNSMFYSSLTGDTQIQF